MAKDFKEKIFYYFSNKIAPLPISPLCPQHAFKVQLQFIPVLLPLLHSDHRYAFPEYHTIISFFYLPPVITHLKDI